MSLALGLARHGVRSTLFEAKSELDPHSRALGILPRTLEVFRTWGIYERLVLEGTLISKVDFWIVGRDKPMVRLDLSVFARLSAAPGLLVLPQNRTAFYSSEEVELAVAGLKKGETAALEFVPAARDLRTLSFPFTGDGSTIAAGVSAVRCSLRTQRSLTRKLSGRLPQAQMASGPPIASRSQPEHRAIALPASSVRTRTREKQWRHT